MSDLEFTISGTIPATRKEQFLAAILAAMEDQPTPPPVRDPDVTEIDVTVSAPTTVNVRLRADLGDGNTFLKNVDSTGTGTDITITTSSNGSYDYADIAVDYPAAGDYTIAITHTRGKNTAIEQRPNNSAFVGGMNTVVTAVRFADEVVFVDSFSMKVLGVTEVVFGEGLHTLMMAALVQCVSLKSITFLAAEPPTIKNNVFVGVPADCAIYVPASSVDAYKATSQLSSRADYIQAIPA